MHFALLSFLSLSTLAAPARVNPPVSFDPLPVNLQSCLVQNSRGLTGQSFVGTAFKPVNDQILLKGTVGGVAFSLHTKYTPNKPAGQFAPNNFVIELQKGNEIQTLEAYVSPADSTKVLISSKDARGSSVAFSRGPGPQSLKMFALNVNWSVQKTANGQVTKFHVNNQVDVTLNQLTGSFEPQIAILRQDTVVVSGGVCNQ